MKEKGDERRRGTPGLPHLTAYIRRRREGGRDGYVKVGGEGR